MVAGKLLFEITAAALISDLLLEIDMSKRYHLVGAFDRHNYGDILFPLVHTEALLENHVQAEQIHYCAITAADLTAEGGYKTQSVKQLLSSSLSKDDVVVLCGGDILSADWMLMVAHLHSPIYLKSARAMRSLLGVVRTNDMVRKLLGELNSFPYVISNNDCDALIYYTSVGGAGFTSAEHLKRVVDELKKVHRISVRDREVMQALNGHGISASLVPDTALVMSDFFAPEKLSARSWKTKLKVYGDFDESHYFSFQGAKRLLEGSLDQLAEEIVKTYRLTGMAPMFVPIGRAPDHEDHVVLENLFEKTKQAGIPCAYQDSLHILDIMTSLAFAKTYVGTSLHGAITTYSFGRKPTALFCDEVKKLKDFLGTWLLPDDYALHPTAQFSERLHLLVQTDSAIQGKQQLRAQKDMVRQELNQYV